MGRPKLTLELCKTIAASRGGRILSTLYCSNRGLLLWECGKGHQWQASFHNVKDGGSWCPICAKTRPLGLPAATKAAKSLGGDCLSDNYTNVNASLLWRCAHGHTWRACLNSVKNRGTWCPTCRGKGPLTLLLLACLKLA